MRLLCFQVRRFAWKPFECALADAVDAPAGAEVGEAVVAFAHVEPADVEGEAAASAFRQALRHLKWLANKRQLRVVVLHSFAHLGADGAAPAAAQALLERLAGRLSETGYLTYVTPFGWSNEWEISVHGESLAKVWKQI
ncbi:MAG: threonyl-tRNA synthetase editing domain-containing protein [Deltaproteobacteria bacterium]|nr:threonyl-tRNA synthetase editing domain-containing protein [Deltaproteobacteria bacterium]